jgi:hypothetical protein
MNGFTATLNEKPGLICQMPISETNAAPVGASLLAMVSRATRSSRKNALSLTSIASKLAPTKPGF